MGSGAVVVLNVPGKNVFQMAFAEDDLVIQAFTTDRSDRAFRISVLPRKASRGHDTREAEGLCLSLKSPPIYGAAIADQISLLLGVGSN